MSDRRVQVMAAFARIVDAAAVAVVDDEENVGWCEDADIVAALRDDKSVAAIVALAIAAARDRLSAGPG